MTRLNRAVVSGNFFDVLGARAVIGRALRAQDHMSGAGSGASQGSGVHDGHPEAQHFGEKRPLLDRVQ